MTVGNHLSGIRISSVRIKKSADIHSPYAIRLAV